MIIGIKTDTSKVLDKRPFSSRALLSAMLAIRNSAKDICG